MENKKPNFFKLLMQAGFGLLMVPVLVVMIVLLILIIL